MLLAVGENTVIAGAIHSGVKLLSRGIPLQSQARARGMRHIDLTDVQLASSETARRINRDIVLELIRANPPISRADLSRQSGLQRSTVSQIV